MNNIRIYAFFWMIVLLTVSCYEDKGNYDYETVPLVSVSGIEKSYDFYVGHRKRLPQP